MIAEAAILDKTNGPLKIKDIEIPKLREGDVLVRIHYSGICGSQINEIKGIRDTSKFYPHLFGHEASGVVVDVGKKVSKVKMGDHVICTWIKLNGLDDGPKKYGKYNAGSITTFQNYSVISENRLIKFDPRGLSMKEAALYGCMVPTGVSVVDNNYLEGKNVLVMGTGNIGMACLLGLGYCVPHLKVYSFDIKKDRNALARKLGATIVYGEDMKFDNIIDTTGNISVIKQLLNNLAYRGKMILVGNCKPQGSVKVNIMNLILNSHTIIGGNGSNIDEYIFNNYILAVDTNLIPIKVFSANNVNEAFEEFYNYAGKVVVKYV